MVSTYGEGIINRLHPNSPLRQEGNPARTLIMKTIGAWLDDYDVTNLYENSFLETATGDWLDLYGRDLGVVRQLDESDDDYRTRLIYASIGNLSIDYLLNVFDLSLYSFREDFNVEDNTLVSDNPFLNTGGYISVADRDVISIMDRKLLLDGSVSWVTEYGSLDYVLDGHGINLLSSYRNIYTLTKPSSFFRKNTSIENVKLFLPNATSCSGMFEYCTYLKNVDLKIPHVTNVTGMFSNCTALTEVNIISDKINDCLSLFSGCSALTEVNLDLPNGASFVNMFRNCSSLTNVKLNLPKLNYYSTMFYNCSNLETINVNIPTNKVSDFKSYVTGLNLENLTSFIINGEEQL